MGSKVFLLLGLLVAIVLLISSEVAARDLAETSTENKNGNGVENAKHSGNGGYPNHGGYGGNPGHGGYGGNPGHGGYGGNPGHGGYGGNPGHGGYGGNPGHGGYGGNPGHGGYGGNPGHGGYGGNPGYGGNGGHGGHGGGYCRYGCCNKGYYGSGCKRCCSYAGEVVDTKTVGGSHD